MAAVAAASQRRVEKRRQSSLPGVGLSFDTSQFRKLEEAFFAVDRDEDCALDRAELQDMWRIIFPAVSHSHIRSMTDAVMADLDPNGDGEVSFGELRNYILNDAGRAERRSDVDRLLAGTFRIGRPETLRELVWCVVEVGAQQFADPPLWLPHVRMAYTVFSQGMIILSAVLMILESLPSLQRKDDQPGNSATAGLEALCVSFFTLELIVRAVATPTRIRFWKEVFTWIDVLSILPFYISLFVDENPAGPLLVLRVARLLRLLRMFKLGHHFVAVQLMLLAVQRSMYPVLVLLVGVNIIAVTLAGSLMYTAELKDADFNFTEQRWYRRPDSKYLDKGEILMFQSIPDAMWWALVTVTTVGYGDSYPFTEAGKCAAAFTMMAGLVLVTFPITLVSTSFDDVSKELERKRQAYDRRRHFHHQIAKGSVIAARRPISLLEVGDFCVGMPVRHFRRGIGECIAVDPEAERVRVQFLDDSASCRRQHTYDAISLRAGKLCALWGIRDFPVGSRVEHGKRGQGTVTEADFDVTVKFDTGDVHKYRPASLAKGKLKPLEPDKACSASQSQGGADASGADASPKLLWNSAVHMPAAAHAPDSPRTDDGTEDDFPHQRERLFSTGNQAPSAPPPRKGSAFALDLRFTELKGEMRDNQEATDAKLDGLAARMDALTQAIASIAATVKAPLAQQLQQQQECSLPPQPPVVAASGSASASHNGPESRVRTGFMDHDASSQATATSFGEASPAAADSRQKYLTGGQNTSNEPFF
eukprot:TRINITY_DN15167_c0_g1_i1.p1 TRINITY_DN15167_c0_g1~~TRINITY_DN15167_c0_g1_i1.p1  ORF type:complete len:761 (+),score=127.92 TRINITY_DN15167_c0_g1_i1:183-2465(+)